MTLLYLSTNTTEKLHTVSVKYLCMKILNLCFTYENRAKGVTTAMQTVQAVQTTLHHTSPTIHAGKAILLLLDDNLHRFFCVHTFCLHARRRDLKFKNPSWNRVKVAAKRWLGQIPTVPLCSDRPDMCPPKTWCQQLESSLHKETLNLKP